MKKIIIVLMLTIAVVNSFSQSLFNGRYKQMRTSKSKLENNTTRPKSLYLFQDFQSGTMPANYVVLNVDGNSMPPTDMPLLTQAWVVATGDGISSTNSIAMSSGWEANATANDWMILPKISITTGTYLKWKSMVYFGGGTTQNYEVKIATSIAGSSPVPSDFTNIPVATVSEGAYTWQQHSIDIDALGYVNCDIWVAFRNVSLGATDPFETDILFIDDISVSNPVTIDAALQSINIPSINGMTLPIGAVLRNEGVQNITSFDFNYQINGANTSSTQHVSGLNLAMNDTISFFHSTSNVFSTTGDYFVNVNVFNVNGGIDGDTTNNKLTRKIIIGEDNNTIKIPLFEYFGSNDWPLGEGGMYDFYATAMNNFNTNYFNNTSNYSKATFISYQQSPDTYSIPECVTRNSYYIVAGSPSVFVDGVEDLEFNDFSYLSTLNQQPAFFSFYTVKTIQDNSISVDVTINPYATVNARLHVAIVEKVTTGNLGEADVTAYKNVLMKMPTGEFGQQVSLTKGNASNFVYNVDMTGTHVEQMSDLIAVVFLQDSVSKYVYQSSSTEVQTNVYENQSANSIEIYPNPTKGIINISNFKSGKIEIYNQIGVKVFETEEEMVNMIDVRGLAAGSYLFRVIANGTVEIKKIVIQ